MNMSEIRTVPTVAMLRHLVQLAIFCLLMVSTGLGDVSLKKGENRVSAKTRERRNAVRSQTLPGNEQLLNIIEEYDSNSVDVNLLRYTPTTPSPEDVNCYVEVPVGEPRRIRITQTRRVGGRCVLLGSSTWGCQAGIFLAFSSECQSEAANQTSSQSGTQSPSDDAAQSVIAVSNRQRNPFRRRRRPT